MAIFISDSGGTLWQVSADNTGALTTASFSVNTVPPVFITDTTGIASWQLNISTGGILSTTSVPFNAAYPTKLTLSPSFLLQISSIGLFQSVAVTTTGAGQPLYQYLTYAQSKQELANRLYDPNEVFWTDPELGVYIIEALRTWNAYAAFWRGDFAFNTKQGVTWYDLTDIVAMPNTLRPYTVLDTAIYQTIQYHFLEPATGVNPWPGSSQFTAADFVSAVSRRRDEILSTTGCTVTQRPISPVAQRIRLPDTVIDLRRVAYVPAVGLPYTLWPDDTWAEQAYNRLYTLQPPGLPTVYLRSTQPPITFDTDKVPGSAGAYDILTIDTGQTLLPTIPSTLLIPDDWTPTIKWGAMADLLSRESNAKDELRAAYCEQRYRMDLALLQMAPAMLAFRLNNVGLQISSVIDADYYTTGWQALPQGKPGSLYYAGLNLFALSPAADQGPYSGLVTVVQNAPIPVNGSDLVQVGRDDLDVIIDYAQHLASFKMGGTEFSRTIPLFERFMKQTALYGLKLNEIAQYTSALYALANTEKAINPIMQPDTQGSGGPKE